MCTMVYLSTDIPIEVKEYDENTDYSFYIYETTEDIEFIKKHVSYENIFILGAYDGCACGFYNDSVDEDKDDPDFIKSKQSIKELKEFLIELQKQTESIEIYSCWIGDEDEKRKSTIELDPQNIDIENFDFEERELINLVSST